jgi:hypothetical protein
MTEVEIKRVLAAVVAYDNRKPSNANITAWLEASDRGRWTFNEALEAVHQHYTTSTDFLMPGHVTAIIKANRRQPEHHVPALEAAKAAPERIQGLIDEVARRLGWQRTVQSHSDPARAVECPYCHAAQGRPCSRMATRGHRRGEHVPLSAPHPSRIELAESLDRRSEG